MRFSTSKHLGLRSLGLGSLATAMLVGGLLMGAAPASAGNFERAFERELGRIAAHEVARLGHYVLSGGYAYAAPPVRVVHAPPRYYAPPRRVLRRHRRHHGRRCHHPSHREHIVYERYERWGR